MDRIFLFSIPGTLIVFPTDSWNQPGSIFALTPPTVASGIGPSSYFPIFVNGNVNF